MRRENVNGIFGIIQKNVANTCLLPLTLANCIHTSSCHSSLHLLSSTHSCRINSSYFQQVPSHLFSHSWLYFHRLVACMTAIHFAKDNSRNSGNIKYSTVLKAREMIRMSEGKHVSLGEAGGNHFGREKCLLDALRPELTFVSTLHPRVTDRPLIVTGTRNSSLPLPILTSDKLFPPLFPRLCSAFLHNICLLTSQMLHYICK